MLENIKETLINGLSLTTYEHHLIDLKSIINNEDEQYLLLLEGESDAYTALLTKFFPEVDIEEIMTNAINKADSEINVKVDEEEKLAA